MLVNKCWILNGKIHGSLDSVTRILMACVQIHNFIVQQDHPFDNQFSSVEEEIDGLNVVPDPKASLEILYLLVVPDATFEVYPGDSHSRESIVEFLRESDILLPLHNVEWKKRELACSDAVSTVYSPSGIEKDREYISPL
jgi:hypothetical protein